MIKKIKYLAILAIIMLPFVSCSDDAKPVVEPPIVIAEESIMPKPELRGVWMATTSEIDWPLGKQERLNVQ